MKTLYNKFFLLAIFTLIFTNSLLAQVTILPYKNGFEGTATDWTFVADANNPANTWVVGSAVRLSGNKSLYVSYDNGTNANYNDTAASTIFAYREFTLPEYHSYSIYFDWRSKGALDDSLYVCWVEDATQIIAPGLNGSLPAWVNTTKKLVLGGTVNGDDSEWGNASFSVCGTGQPAKLVFVWTNNGNNNGPYFTFADVSVAGSIDNLQINQNLDLHYKTGFDSPAEIAGWELANRPTLANKWCFGSANYLTPGGALYISADNGVTNGYTDVRCAVSAIKEFTIPAGEQFTVDFDWMAGGNSGDYLYVGFLTDSTRTSTQLSGSLPSPPAWFNGTKLNNSIIWKHHNATFTGIGRPARLVFMWLNDNTINRTPAGIIDNITIRKVGGCQPPPNINTVVNGRDITVTWNSNGADSYNLSYINTYVENSQYVTIQNVTSPYTVPNLERGIYSFFINGVCENGLMYCGANGNIELKNDTSAAATKHSILVVVNEGCIDYTNLTNTSIAQGQYGKWGYSPSTINGIIDYGYINYESRHTIHYVPEYDTITRNGLRTIPEGALASVRLGNKGCDNEWEGITYTFNVDPEYTVLVLKYAIVLEDPSHSASDQPKFTLEILNASGQSIDPNCGDAIFIAGQNLDNTWHIIPQSNQDPIIVPYNATGSQTRNAQTIVWKEWTTVGLNLSDYAGQTVKVRLRNYDCSQGAHFGYTYFTLDCAKGELEGLSCGENSTGEIKAPAGFDYCWYKKYNPNGTLATYNDHNCVARTQTFTPASNDTATYVCRVMFQGKPNCFYNLSARLAPRWPHAQGSYVWAPSNCQNAVKLIDETGIYYGTTFSDESVEIVQWTVTQGGNTVFTSNEKEPIVPMPDEGGTYYVHLVAGLMNNQCTEDTIFRISVPQIGATHEIIEKTICEAQLPIVIGGKEYIEGGEYNDTIVTLAGCDSILTVILTVGYEMSETKEITICHGDSVLFDGVYLKSTGVYTATYSTNSNCDSVVVLNLTVNPVVDISITDIPSDICADDPSFTVSYENKGGSAPTKYILTFNKAAKDAGFTDKEILADNTPKVVIELPEKLRPNKYNVDIEFIDEGYNCEGTIKSIPFDVLYPNYIIEQKWNDVIALLNPNAIVASSKYGHTSNVADYTFKAYQWYKNGAPIKDKVGSYIYLEDGLEASAKYKVLLTRVSDGLSLFTCEITPKQYTECCSIPTIIPEGNVAKIFAAESGTVNIYSVTGILISSQRFNSGESIINTPTAAGIYIVNIKLDNGNSYQQKIVVN